MASVRLTLSSVISMQLPCQITEASYNDKTGLKFVVGGVGAFKWTTSSNLKLSQGLGLTTRERTFLIFLHSLFEKYHNINLQKLVQKLFALPDRRKIINILFKNVGQEGQDRDAFKFLHVEYSYIQTYVEVIRYYTFFIYPNYCLNLDFH